MRKPLLTCALVGVMALAGSSVWAKSSMPILTVPNHGGYAQLNLPDTFAKIVFPPGTKLDGKVVALNHGRTLLVKFMPHSIKHTLIGFVSLSNGDVFRIGFAQKNGAQSPVWDAPGLNTNIRAWQTPPTLSWIVKAMRSTVMDGQPTGMVAAKLPPAVTLGPISAAPLASWSGGGYTLLEYRLSAKALTPIEPRDFYRKGVVAVLTQTDVVSPVHSPAVLILERATDD